MTSIKKSVILACAASVLSFGVALAQTDPNAAPAAPAAGDQAAPAAGGDTMAKPMMKKHMSKKKMSKKHMMMKKAM